MKGSYNQVIVLGMQKGLISASGIRMLFVYMQSVFDTSQWSLTKGHEAPADLHSKSAESKWGPAGLINLSN